MLEMFLNFFTVEFTSQLGMVQLLGRNIWMDASCDKRCWPLIYANVDFTLTLSLCNNALLLLKDQKNNLFLPFRCQQVVITAGSNWRRCIWAAGEQWDLKCFRQSEISPSFASPATVIRNPFPAAVEMSGCYHRERPSRLRAAQALKIRRNQKPLAVVCGCHDSLRSWKGFRLAGGEEICIFRRTKVKLISGHPW